MNLIFKCAIPVCTILSKLSVPWKAGSIFISHENCAGVQKKEKENNRKKTPDVQ